MWSLLGSLFYGGLISAGIGAATSIYGANQSAASADRAAELAYQSQKETNEQNYRIFKENQAWQERMSNTAHRREVDDLRAAGLNPILSATGGSGASVPNVSAPTMVSPGSSVADKAMIYSGMVNGIVNSLGSATDIAEKLSKINLNFANSEQTRKVTDKEVGKRYPFTWAVNSLEGNARNVQTFAKEAGGLLSDIYSGMRTQVNYMQKVFQYNAARGLKNLNGVHDFGLSDQMNGVRLE